MDQQINNKGFKTSTNKKLDALNVIKPFIFLQKYTEKY